MALPHVDERQLLFQGVLTLVPNQEREREPPHFYLPPLPSLFIPWTQSFPVPCEHFHSRPQMKNAGMLSCPSPPASCWKGRGCVGVFGEVRTVPSGHALQSAPIQTQGFKSYFPFVLWNAETRLAGNETLLCIRGPAALSASLRLCGSEAALWSVGG